MWNFLRWMFGRRNIEQKKEVSENTPDLADTDPVTPLSQQIHHELSLVHENYIRFALQDSESRRHFFAALMPGDILVGGDSTYIITAISPGENPVWHFIESNPRMSRFKKGKVTAKRIASIDVREAFSMRGSTAPEEVSAINDTVLENLKVYFGFNDTGLKLRNLLATQVSPLYFGVNPESGAILAVASIAAEVRQAGVIVASVDVSHLSRINEPRLGSPRLYGELKDHAVKALEQTVKLVNRMDQVQRIKLWESIT